MNILKNLILKIDKVIEINVDEDYLIKRIIKEHQKVK